MADEIRRVETVEERPRDTTVVREKRGSSVWAIILGIILILLVLFWLIGNPFANDSTDVTPEVNVPNEVNVDVPSPDVNLPDVDINSTPENSTQENTTTPENTETGQ